MFHIFSIHAKGVCLLTVVVPEDIPCWNLLDAGDDRSIHGGSRDLEQTRLDGLMFICFDKIKEHKNNTMLYELYVFIYIYTHQSIHIHVELYGVYCVMYSFTDFIVAIGYPGKSCLDILKQCPMSTSWDEASQGGFLEFQNLCLEFRKCVSRTS